jgi:hypothetical protein
MMRPLFFNVDYAHPTGIAIDEMAHKGGFLWNRNKGAGARTNRESLAICWDLHLIGIRLEL